MQKLLGAASLMAAGCCVSAAVHATASLELWVFAAGAVACAVVGRKIYHNAYEGGQ